MGKVGLISPSWDKNLGKKHFMFILSHIEILQNTSGTKKNLMPRRNEVCAKKVQPLVI